MTRKLARAALALLVLAAVAIYLSRIPWLWHPLGDCTGTTAAIIRCKSYNFWSGISGSNVTLPFVVAAFILGWWHQHNCHSPGCPWLIWHPHPDHRHPVCKRCFKKPGHEDLA